MIKGVVLAAALLGATAASAEVTFVGTIKITAVTPQGGPDTRQVFAGWSDSVPTNPRSITASPEASYSMIFTIEHKLTTQGREVPVAVAPQLLDAGEQVGVGPAALIFVVAPSCPPGPPFSALVWSATSCR